MASDKLFYFLFHNSPDLILRWQLDWRVVLIAPHRQMKFGALTQALSLLLQPESQVRSVSDASEAEVLPLIPAILLARFNKRPLQEICTMAGITLEDFTQSRAY